MPKAPVDDLPLVTIDHAVAGGGDLPPLHGIRARSALVTDIAHGEDLVATFLRRARDRQSASG